MERIKWIPLLFLAIFTIASGSCKEDVTGQPATNGIAPGMVRNVKVENIPGGAVLTYDLPDDEDLLYVKALYTINGVEKNTSASVYNNSLRIKGFGNTQEQTIQLYCVDRSENISEPIEVKIQPETPPVQLIYESFEMSADFGGVRLTWENKYNEEVALYFIAADSIGDMNVAEVIYTSTNEGLYKLRGFDATERLFGVYVRDRWDNYSDTLTGKFIPFHETYLDKSLFRREILQADHTAATDLGGWGFNKMWNEVMGNEGWHSTGSTPSPILFTIDLGVKVKLSRYTLWHRLGVDWSFAHQNPKKWTIYGTDEIRRDIYDDEYWKEGGFAEDWPVQIYCEPVKPSGLPVGENSQEDVEYAERGFEFDFPIDAPPVRYIRFWIHDTWSGGIHCHISELSFWGEIVEE